MANSNRLKILHLIHTSPEQKLTVTQLVEKLDLSQGNVSTHLVMMRRAGILKATQSSMHMYYAIKDADVVKLVKEMLV